MFYNEEIIKVEEAIDTSGEIPEAISFPPIKTEPEVKLGVFMRWWQLLLLWPFDGTKAKFLNYTKVFAALCYIMGAT